MRGYGAGGEGYRDWGDESQRGFEGHRAGGLSEEGNFLGGRSRHADRPQAWAGSGYGAGGQNRPYGREYGSGYGARHVDDRSYGERGRHEEHGMLYELGHRIGEAVGGLFGQEPDRRRVGPKGYQRSDERIHEAVCERLAYADGLDLSDVTVQVNGGVVKLTGSVRSRSEKFDIEDIADNVYGVTDVDNEIRVRSRDVSSPEKMTDLKNWTPD
ncbi:BON domain-containing protein [Cupriavidus sp. AU9028]|nr:BON domain-containing protein [Cupriavidus sp. AU9028]